MFVHCPSCGSKHVRHSRQISFGEQVLSFLGYHTLRCKDCRYRFRTKVWRFSDLRWSRCPRCYRTELTTWSEDHYLPRFYTLMKMRLGAKRLRCEFCRFNFAGFRPVKNRYRFRKGPLAGSAASNEQQTTNPETVPAD